MCLYLYLYTYVKFPGCIQNGRVFEDERSVFTERSPPRDSGAILPGCGSHLNTMYAPNLGNL